MFNAGYGNGGDFESLARQYWSAWGESMRHGAMGATPAPPPPAGNWQQAVDWWSQLLPRTPSPANDAVARFNQQARDWYGQMQQVAAQFAGRDNSASEVSQAWRQALGASGANPFPEMFKAMSGKGVHGLDDWIGQAQPFLDQVQQQAERWLHLPAFGEHREQQERLQGLVQANLDYQKHSGEFNALMGSCAQRAFAVFEEKLEQRAAPGQQVSSARGLFDLWVDAAEQAYAESALSEEFRHRYGALTNAQMRLRAAVQVEIEQIGTRFGMPTRTEVDSAHRKIAELERALRRASAAALRPQAARQAAPTRTATNAGDGAAPASAQAVGKKSTAGKARAGKKAATKATASSKAGKSSGATSKVASRKTASKVAKAAGKKAVAAKANGKKPAGKTTERRSTRLETTKSKTTKRKGTKRKTSKRTAPVAGAAGKGVAAKTAGAASGAKTRRARAAAAKSKATAKPATSKVARKAGRKIAGSAASKAQAAQPAPASSRQDSGQVVSMKDWVARYAAAQAGASGGANEESAIRRRKGARK